MWTTACLLASSGTVHVAERTLERGNQAGFILWWLLTIVLGAVFLGGTAFEWRDLIDRHGLTISRNLFGTTYYTLVGLHALHVTGGAAVLLIAGSQVRAGPTTFVGLAYALDPPAPTGGILAVAQPDGSFVNYALNMADPQWGIIKGLFVPANGAVPNLDVTSLPIAVTGNIDMPNGKLVP